MPIINLTTDHSYPVVLSLADSFFSRLVGLLGTAEKGQESLHIVPCNSIHTFGMKYPVDILFLDRAESVVKMISCMKPNRMACSPPSVHSVIELPAGYIARSGIRAGHRLKTVPDAKHKPAPETLRNIFHWPVNLAMALLWSRFVLDSAGDWFLKGNFLQTGILIHNTLLLVLFLTRRKSSQTSARFLDWLIPIITLGCTMLIKPHTTGSSATALFSFSVQCVGMSGIILSLLSLGRSFGIVPANRKIKSSGIYGVVRHPLYISELIFYTGFLAGNFLPRNCILILLIVAGQIWRSISEEKLLCQDADYRAYADRVHYRFIPGVF